MNSDHSVWKKNGRDIIRFGENIVFSNYSKSGVSIGNMYSNNVRNLLKMTPLLPAYNDSGDYYIYKDMVEDGWEFDQAVNNRWPIWIIPGKTGILLQEDYKPTHFWKSCPLKN
jgi:hypothetical protein